MFRILFLLVCIASLVSAADVHLTSAGAGKSDGSNWENALSAKDLQRAIDTLLQPGDRLVVGSGTYQDVAVTIAHGGAEGRPKSIVGVDRGAGLPIFASTWSIDAPAKGRIAFQLGPQVSHLTMQHLRIQGYAIGIQAPPAKDGSTRSHCTFEDVDMQQMRHGFYLSDCADFQLIGCDLKRYSKHAFRFDQGCSRFVIRQCTADCSEGDAAWELKTELLPFGFTVTDSGRLNISFTFQDCLARNHMKPNQTNRYKNGDGFVVEGNAANVTFERCRSIRNQDGGFDLKVADVRLTDCAAIGNGRAFRIWKTGTLTNCFAGWGGTGLWSNGGPVTATRCTFHELSSSAAMTDDAATAPVFLKECLISSTRQPTHRTAANGRIELQETIVSEKDPVYPNPKPDWDGLGSAMNSRTYPNRGYRANGAR
jgi:hypothetical protein